MGPNDWSEDRELRPGQGFDESEVGGLPEGADDADGEYEGFDPLDRVSGGDPALDGRQVAGGGPEGWGEDAETQEEPGRVRGRANERIRRQQEEMRLERERNNQLQREIAEMRARQQQWEQQQQHYTEEQQISLLPYEQQVEYRFRKERERNALEIQKLQVQQTIYADQTRYQAAAMHDPDRRRLADSVESVFQTQLQQGRYIERDTIYTYLRGQEVLQQSSRKRVQTPAAQRQRVAAPNPGSNQQSSGSRRGGKPQSLEEREAWLANKTF